MRIPPSTLLATLIAIASIAGAVFHSQKVNKISSNNPQQTQKIAELQQQITVLQGENQTLKKLQVNGAELTLPLALYKFAEQNLGLTFPQHVKARRVDDNSLAEAVRYRYTKHFQIEGMEMRQYAFETLGILPANQNLVGQLAIAETSGAVAIYDSSANEILLSAAFDEENLLHTTSIVKHLAIALLELNFPLTNSQKTTLTDDAYHARQAFIRGRASSIAQRYRNITAFKGGHTKQFKPNLEAQEIFNSLPTLIQGITTFPTIHGKTYIEDIILQHDSVFPEIYIHMPQSTATIFTKNMPSTQPPTERQPLTEKQHLSTQLGQLFAMLYLKQLGDQQLGSKNAQLHQSLTSDHLTITQEERHTYTINWNTQWKTSADAQAFHQLATKLSNIPERKPTVTISENQVIITFIDIQSTH